MHLIDKGYYIFAYYLKTLTASYLSARHLLVTTCEDTPVSFCSGDKWFIMAVEPCQCHKYSATRGKSIPGEHGCSGGGESSLRWTLTTVCMKKEGISEARSA